MSVVIFIQTQFLLVWKTVCPKLFSQIKFKQTKLKKFSLNCFSVSHGKTILPEKLQEKN